MNDVLFNAPRVPLKVNQIACLEHDNANLYGEVIQLVPLRQLCWFRPMCLVISDLSGSNVSKGFSQTQYSESLQECEPASLPQQTTKNFSKAISLSSLKDSSAPHFSLPEARLINLQSASDLLWATILFRPALDTEVISFLAQLHDTELSSVELRLNHQLFNKFIHSFWQANQDKF